MEVKFTHFFNYLCRKLKVRWRAEYDVINKNSQLINCYLLVKSQEISKGIGKGEFFAKLSAMKDAMHWIEDNYEEQLEKIVDETVKSNGDNLFTGSRYENRSRRKKKEQISLSADP